MCILINTPCIRKQFHHNCRTHYTYIALNCNLPQPLSLPPSLSFSLSPLSLLILKSQQKNIFLRKSRHVQCITYCARVLCQLINKPTYCCTHTQHKQRELHA